MQIYDIVSLVPGLCDALTGEGLIDGGLPFLQNLKQSSLDYSLDSLRVLDRYLDYLYDHADEIEDQQYTNLILSAGCYVGEVMRRLTGDKYQWVNYADFFPRDPKWSHIPEQPGTSAILVSKRGRMMMPLNKIARYIGEGPENSVHHFVAAELSAERGTKTQITDANQSKSIIIVDLEHEYVGRPEGGKECVRYSLAPCTAFTVDTRKFDFSKSLYPNVMPNAIHVVIADDRKY